MLYNKFLEKLPLSKNIPKHAKTIPQRKEGSIPCSYPTGTELMMLSFLLG